MPRDLFLDYSEGPVLIDGAGSWDGAAVAVGRVHGRVAVSVCWGGGGVLGRVEPCCFVVVGGDDGDFVGIVAGEVSVDEDEDVGDCL